MTLSHWTDTEMDRMLAEADRREAVEARRRAEREAALLRKYEPPYRPSAWAWHYALMRTAAVLWIGAAVMAFVGLLAVLP